MLASIELEKRGIPSLSLCTEAFRGALAAIAEIQGRPDKSWAEVAHPFGSLGATEVRTRAEFFVQEFYRTVLTE